MKTFETSAIVEAHGQVRVAGVPFAPGIEVEVTIREKVATDANASAANSEEARVHMKDLLARVRARNTEPIGALRREELYDRKVFVDTNVLLYAASNAVADQGRRDAAWNCSTERI